MNGVVTRFGERNMPPHLFHIAQRKEWRETAELYLPESETISDHRTSVPVCDLDRLDAYVSQHYFTADWLASLHREESLLRKWTSSLSKSLAYVPVQLARVLNGSNTEGSFIRKKRDSTTRLNNKTAAREALKKEPNALLIVLSTENLSQEDVAWDYEEVCDSQRVLLPRLKRPISKIDDVYAEYDLLYDATQCLVALPPAGELLEKFAKCKHIRSALD